MGGLQLFLDGIWGVLKCQKMTLGGSSDGRLCDFCESHPWVGPESERIPQPIPDPTKHALIVWRVLTPLRNDDGSRRDPHDWQAS